MRLIKVHANYPKHQHNNNNNNNNNNKNKGPHKRDNFHINLTLCNVISIYYFQVLTHYWYHGVYWDPMGPIGGC